MSLAYRPSASCESRLPHALILPVVGESPSELRHTLFTILLQRPSEMFVGLNGGRDVGLEAVCADFFPEVRWGWNPMADKRHAQASGLRNSTGDIVIFVDSDTHWTNEHDGTLNELLKPFADPRVGGVTTHQCIRNGHTSIIARFAAWLEAVRWIFGPPAQSALGQVGVLPGRTIAFRRHILMANLDEFLSAPMKIQP